MKIINTKTPLIMGKAKKQSCSSLYLLGALMTCGTLVSSCKPNEQKAGAQLPANAQKDASHAQPPSESIKPKIDFVATEKLYKKIKQKKLGTGAKTSFVTISSTAGILIHPGVSPTEVRFDVSGMKETLKIAFYIGVLPQNILPIAKAGTVGFEVFVDGKSQGRKRLDRFTNQTLLVNPLEVSELRIVVDNDDGSQTCDWFFMGLQ